MSGPWGTGSWGIGAFGGLSGPLYVVSAEAFSTNTVRVTLSVAPIALSSTTAGDALNPATWTIVRQDNGFSFTIASVEHASADGVTFDIAILQSLGAYNITHRVQTLTLLKPNGQLVASPNYADFPGAAVQTQTLSQQASPYVDLANPPTPGGTQQ